VKILSSSVALVPYAPPAPRAPENANDGTSRNFAEQILNNVQLHPKPLSHRLLFNVSRANIILTQKTPGNSLMARGLHLLGKTAVITAALTAIPLSLTEGVFALITSIPVYCIRKMKVKVPEYPIDSTVLKIHCYAANSFMIAGVSFTGLFTRSFAREIPLSLNSILDTKTHILSSYFTQAAYMKLSKFEGNTEEKVNEMLGRLDTIIGVGLLNLYHQLCEDIPRDIEALIQKFIHSDRLEELNINQDDVAFLRTHTKNIITFVEALRNTATRARLISIVGSILHELGYIQRVQRTPEGEVEVVIASGNEAEKIYQGFLVEKVRDAISLIREKGLLADDDMIQAGGIVAVANITQYLELTDPTNPLPEKSSARLKEIIDRRKEIIGNAKTTLASLSDSDRELLLQELSGQELTEEPKDSVKFQELIRSIGILSGQLYQGPLMSDTTLNSSGEQLPRNFFQEVYEGAF
jgi:hypothetical protein